MNNACFVNVVERLTMVNTKTTWSIQKPPARTTPVSGVGKDAQVEVGPDVVQILKGEAASGLGDVVVAIPVEDAGFDPVKGAASGELEVTHAHGVVGDGGHEASEASDAVVLGIQDADAAEV